MLCLGLLALSLFLVLQELVPRTVRYSIDHTGDRGVDDHRRYVSLWQVGVTRELGRTGLAVAVPLTALLIGAAVWSAIALRRAIATPT